MTDYAELLLQPTPRPSLIQPAADAIRRSFTRNSHYSNKAVSATTRSWVYSQQHPPSSSPPLPLPIPLPSPVHPLPPLPNQHVHHRYPAVLRTVNPSEHDEHQERMDYFSENVHFAHQKPEPNKLRRPSNSANNPHVKKRTAIGGFVKTIRRIPKVMFGYGAGKRTTLKRRGTFGADSEGTPTSVTGMTTRTGNTLPQYASNPPTPVVPPIPSHYTHQQMGLQLSTVPLSGSPPPEVVRLDDVRRRRPDFRIMPPSANIARSQTAHFYPGTNNSHFTDNRPDSSSSSSAAAPNTAERTTVMLYHDPDPTPAPTSPLPLSRQISSNGPPGRLSYVGSEQVVRPTSFHGGSQAPPPIEIPSSIARIGTPASNLSYVSQVVTVPPVKRSSSQLRSHLSYQLQPQSQPHQPTIPQHQPSSTPPPISESSEPMQSPISANPQPTTDYLKMALSPPHSLQHHTTALSHLTSTTNPSSSRVTSFSYDPSFSATSGPIARFFKTVYYMPWISYGRITVDYLPGKVKHVHGHTLGRETSSRRASARTRADEKRMRETREREKRRKDKRSRVGRGDSDGNPISWYNTALSHSRRTNNTGLDLLTSDLASSPATTTRRGAASIGLGLENLSVDAAASPRLAAAAGEVGNPVERERRRRERRGNKQERASHSPRHDRHRQDSRNQHRGRQRRNIGSMGSRKEQYGEDEDESTNRSSSPLIPALYPFHYPPYPYTYPYTGFTMPPPGPYAQSQPEQQHRPLNDQTRTFKQTHRQGPRNNKQGQPFPQPFLYSPAGIPHHPGYTATAAAAGAAAAHAYQPMVAPSMVPQVYFLHSAAAAASHSQLQVQSQTNGSSVANGSGGGGGGVGTIDSDTGNKQAPEQ